MQNNSSGPSLGWSIEYGALREEYYASIEYTS